MAEGGNQGIRSWGLCDGNLESAPGIAYEAVEVRDHVARGGRPVDHRVLAELRKVDLQQERDHGRDGDGDI